MIPQKTVYHQPHKQKTFYFFHQTLTSFGISFLLFTIKANFIKVILREITHCNLKYLVAYLL